MITTVRILGTQRVIRRRTAIAQIGGSALALATLGACGGSDEDSSGGDASDEDFSGPEWLALGTVIARATSGLPPVRAAALAYMIGVGAVEIVDSARDYFANREASAAEEATADFMATNGLFRNPTEGVYERDRRVAWTAMQDIPLVGDQERNGCTALVRGPGDALLLEGQALIALGAVTFAIADQEGLRENETDSVAERLFPTSNIGEVNVLLDRGGRESAFETASGSLVVTRLDDGDLDTAAEIAVATPDGESYSVSVPRLSNV